MQVSTRSPRPLSPASVSRWPPAAHASRVDLGQPARDQRGQRVVAEAQPFDDAGGDRDDVLQRAADLDADHIVAAVSRNDGPRNSRLHELDRPRRRATRRATAVGSCARDFDREARTRQHDDRVAAAELPARSPPTSAAACSASSPLVALTIVARARRETAPRAASPRGSRATAPRTRRARRRRARRRARAVTDTTAGQRDVRQVDGVGAARRHVVDQRAIARPQAHVVTDARQVHGERRAPAAGAEHGDASRIRRALRRRRSVPRPQPRRTFERCRNTMSAAAAHAAATTGAGLPVA